MRSVLFYRVAVEHESEDDLKAIAIQIARQLQKVYSVRSAELSSATNSDE